MTRNGKIARLPRAVRAQLNRRLADGERGQRLVAWLNGLPDTQRVLAADFGGRPISEQNLTEWKQGGHREWLAHQELLAQTGTLAERAEEVRAAGPALTENLAVMVAAHFAGALLTADGPPSAEALRKLAPLRGLCADLVELRRGDHSAARLRIEEERLERDRERTEAELVEQFQRWAQNPVMRELIAEDDLSPEAKARRMRELFGLPPEGPGTRPRSRNQTQSNPVKPLFVKNRPEAEAPRGGGGE